MTGKRPYQPLRCATACSQYPDCQHDWSVWDVPRCPEDGARGTLAAAEGDVLVYVCEKGHDWTEPVADSGPEVTP